MDVRSTSESAPAARSVDPPAGLLVAALCLAEVLGMAASASFPALQPLFLAAWDLSNAEAGWINGVYHGGYVAAVAVLVSLTDRVDPRRIYLAGMAVSAVSAVAFALLADGFWSALVWRALGGIGLAGTYMPGLRILSDRLDGPKATRYLSFYTAAFAIGSAFSTLLSGQVGDQLGWRWAFGVAGAGPLVALVLVAAVVPPAPSRPAPRTTALLDFRPVLRNRPAFGYVAGYACHCWELFGLRAWVVTFLAFAAGPDGPDLSRITLIVTVVLLLGVPSSILGNEMALRFGRRRFLTAAMLASGAVGLAAGFSGGLPFAVVAVLVSLHGTLVMADSASLTVGAVTAADPAHKGATMAVHSLFGFGAAALAPLAFGAILDLAGGGSSGTAWGLAFLGLAAGAALGPLALRLSRSPAAA